MDFSLRPFMSTLHSPCIHIFSYLLMHILTPNFPTHLCTFLPGLNCLLPRTSFTNTQLYQYQCTIRDVRSFPPPIHNTNHMFFFLVTFSPNTHLLVILNFNFLMNTLEYMYGRVKMKNIFSCFIRYKLFNS